VNIPKLKRASAKPAKAVEPTIISAPSAVEASPSVPAPATPPLAKQAPRPEKGNKTAASKLKRKPLDAKTLHARATKSAATRAANKAKVAKPATEEGAT